MSNFDVSDVELLTKEEKPRTKCWKVEVPYKHRELMEKDEMYPPGWRHRKFFGSRKRVEKKARTENNSMETLVIQEEQRNRVRADQEVEDTLAEVSGPVTGCP